jgi:hypothetical protein
MNCRSAESLFSAFLDEALSQAERRSFEAHLLGCRRCSQSLREMRGALALVADVSNRSVAETSPHFEEDLMSRIRSGEAMRPSLVEWAHAFLAPDRLRPLFLTGAAACAVFVAVVLVQRHQPGPSAPALARQESPAPVTGSQQPAPVLASSAGAVDQDRVAQPRTAGANGAVQVADRIVPANRADLDSALPNPDARFADEYVTDKFILQRGRIVTSPPQPSLVPVTDQGSDDVYIEF